MLGGLGNDSVVMMSVCYAVMQVKEEIASVDKAAGIKKSGAAMKSAAAPVVEKPKYDEETRWEVAVALAGGDEEMDIAVRPVQKASLLLKAWANDVGADPEDCERECPLQHDGGECVYLFACRQITWQCPSCIHHLFRLL